MTALLLVGLTATPAAAFPTKLTPNGQLDFTYGANVESAGGSGTAYKPESKLFYTSDGTTRWWAVLGTSGPLPAAGVHLWELVGHVWTARVQLPDADPWAKGDALFDGTTLYVATRDNKASVTGNPRQSNLYEIPYNGGGRWGSVSGPFEITTRNPETLTIAKDSTGRLWTTFEQNNTIKVGNTAPGGTTFTFRTISVTNVKKDDISAVTAFGGNRIGVFWSDQVAKKDFFTWRNDSDAVGTWKPIETAFGGGGACPTANSNLCADDHVNIKVSGDQVYVAVKTSLNDVAGAPGDPLIVLLRRSAGGTWSSFPVSPVSQNATRPITVLSPAQNTIWVWAKKGSEIDVWESSFTSPGFTSSAFIAWVKPGSGAANDSTSTKQVTTDASGTVVEASVSSRTEYWHNEFLPS